MTVQITVRLPGDLVAFVDNLVADGAVTSRADAVTRALTRERRRQAALADVAILRRRGNEPDLDALAEYTAAHPLDLDD
jgi:Arc/MetJ-type ribon-helix-helix transcriptional regulator